MTDLKKTFHLLVNDNAKSVILIGDGKSTAEFDLGPVLSSHDTLPRSLTGIRRILAEVDTKLTDTSDEHIAKWLYADLHKLSKWIYLCQTYRVVFEANKCDARGDVGGEYYGHYLDDGLPSPGNCLRDYQIADVYGYDRKFIRKTMGMLIDNVVGDVGARLDRKDVRDRQLYNLIERVENGEAVVTCDEAINLAKSGACVRCENWSNSRITANPEGGLMFQVFDNGEWRKGERDDLTLRDVTSPWVVMTL